MLALVHTAYTDPSGLRLVERQLPALEPEQVLVRVVAAGLNPFDWHNYRGEPWLMRAQQGVRVDAPRGVGADLAGVVEAVGSAMRRLAPGDRVFGSIGAGAIAERAVAREAALAALPHDVPFASAAAVPMAGLTALQGLRDRGELREGERVLVWGASGGVGHLALQLARSLGASHVAAVCSTRNVELARSLGADAVHDYQRGELPAGPFDLVLDTVSTASVATLKRMLAPAGRVVTVGGTSRAKLLGPAGALVRRTLAAKLQRVDARGMLATVRHADLELLAAELAAGRLRPVIEREYPFRSSVDALRALEAGRVAGKLVIRIGGDEPQP